MAKSKSKSAAVKTAAAAKRASAAGVAKAEEQPAQTLESELAAVELDDSAHLDDSSVQTDDDADFEDAADGTALSVTGSEAGPEGAEPEDVQAAAAEDAATAASAAPAVEAEEQASAETLEAPQVEDEDAATPMPSATEFPAHVQHSALPEEQQEPDSTPQEAEASDESSAAATTPAPVAATSADVPTQRDSKVESSSAARDSSPPKAASQWGLGKGVAALRSRFGSGTVAAPPKPVPTRTTSRPGSDAASAEGSSGGSLPLSSSTATIVGNERTSTASAKDGDGSAMILDEESARQSIADHVEKIPPSKGATSLLEPDETISNPFATDKESPRASANAADAEPQRFSSADSVQIRSREMSAAPDGSDAGHAPDTPGMNSNHFSVVSLSSTTASGSNGAATGAEDWADGDRRRRTVVIASGDDARNSMERTNSNYDFLLARLDNQNAKLTTDPKAMRNSLDGADKLRENFEKLREQDQARHSRGESQNKALNGLPATTVEEEAQPSAGHPADAEAADGHGHWEGPPGEELGEEAINWEFWGNVMSNYQQVARTQPRDLSRAIQAGIPAALRGMMWQLMSSSKDEEMEIVYAYYLKQSSPHEKAIRRDLNRTFPEQDYFQDGKGIGQENLFNVVKAYSLYDPEVGYCQGMQFVVGPLLLNMPDEEAFSTLVRLMKSYDLRGHFTPNMPSLQLRLFQFDRLLEEFLPLLHMHLVRQGVKSSMYASQWFMTLFSYRFPLDLVYRILDSVFAEGVEALFRFALALMKRNEEELLKLNFDSAVAFLKQSLFDVYLKSDDSMPSSPSAAEPSTPAEAAAAEGAITSASGGVPKRKKTYNTNEFVRDAFAIKITPFMLDSYASEFDEQVRAANAHRREVEALRLVNRNLAARVKALEDQLTSVNKEHVDLVKSVVMAKIAKEEMAEELVKYKMMYAEAVTQADQDNGQRGSMGTSNAARFSN